MDRRSSQLNRAAGCDLLKCVATSAMRSCSAIMRVRGYCNLEAGGYGGCVVPTYFRFTPKSGHVQCNSVCPLWVKRRHVRRL